MLPRTVITGLVHRASALALACSFGLILSPPASGVEPPAAASPTTPIGIPAFTETGHMIVQAYLNGQGPFWCLLDTGNTHTAIFRGVADALDLKVEPHGEMLGLGEHTLTVGKTGGLRVEMRGSDATAALDEVIVTVLPDDARMPPFGEHSIDAILGGTLMERFVVQIDYRAGTLTLHDPEIYQPPAGATAIRIRLTGGFPHASGRVAARINASASAEIEGEFLIDIGSGLVIDVQRSALQSVVDLGRAIDGRRTVGRISGIDGEPMDLEAIPAAHVHIDGVALDIAEIMMLPIEGGGPPIDNLIGSLGGPAFHATGITLHYLHGTIYLK